MDTWRTSVTSGSPTEACVCWVLVTCNVNPLEELKPFIYFSQEYLFAIEFRRWEKHPAKSNITVSSVFNKFCFYFLRNMINRSRGNKQNAAAGDDKVPQAPPSCHCAALSLPTGIIWETSAVLKRWGGRTGHQRSGCKCTAALRMNQASAEPQLLERACIHDTHRRQEPP